MRRCRGLRGHGRGHVRGRHHRVRSRVRGGVSLCLLGCSVGSGIGIDSDIGSGIDSDIGSGIDSDIGLPGLNGFVGEFLVLIGSFETARWWVVIATIGVILAALYLLWAYQRVFHGEPSEDNKSFPEITLREGLLLSVFVAAIVFAGVYPKQMLDRIEPSVKALIEHVEASK